MTQMRRLTAWLVVVAALTLAIGPLFLKANGQPSTALAKPCWPDEALHGRDTLYGLIPCNDVRALAPVMREKFECVRSKMTASGRPISLFETWRSRRRQELLYSYSRTRPGPRVTNVQDPATGFHFWGLGFDAIHPVLKWDAPPSYWWHYGQFGEQCGLVAGTFWKSLPDHPHLNWAAWESASRRPAWVKRLQAENKRDSLLLRLGAMR